MRDISELIYETCKTYLITQGKFLMVLWVFIAVVIVLYFGWLAPVIDGSHSSHHSRLQSGRYRRQLRRRVVRYSREHLCKFPHRVRIAARQALSDLSHAS